MTISHILEDFSGIHVNDPVQISELSLEEQRLEAFENGYQAGWDDSAKAQTEDSRKVSADFAQNLRDLTFTYQEAYSAIVQSLRPLMKQMVDAVLPELAQETLGAQLADVMREMAVGSAGGPFKLVTSPANVTALEALLKSYPEFECIVVEDQCLGEGQVCISLETQEREIDLVWALHKLKSLVDEYFDQDMKETA